MSDQHTQLHANWLRQAAATIQQNLPLPAEQRGLLQSIPAGSALHPQAQHVLGIAAFRAGDMVAATALLRAAIAGGDPSPTVITNLIQAALGAGEDPGQLHAYVGDCMAQRFPLSQAAASIQQTLTLLRFDAQGDYDNVHSVFEHVVLPLLLRALREQQYDLALHLENFTYRSLIKMRETEANFSAVFNRWAPAMVEAGREFGRQLPPLPVPTTRPRRIGFMVLNASMLAHIEALLNYLRGLRELPDCELEPVLYCFGGNDPAMFAAFAALNVPVVRLDTEYPQLATQYAARLAKLRERAAADGVVAMVWLSAPLLMPFAFAMPVAPVQIWWTMKYHGLAFAEIDEYVTSLSFTKKLQIDGRDWCSGRLQLKSWFDGSRTAPAAELARQYRPAIILGTLAREEKMTGKDYLNAVTQILKNNPDTVFLWTGRSEHPDIAGHFQREQLSHRTHFLGWVDIKLYAQVLDIFLDSFPFGCGFTALDTMGAGKPVLFMASSLDSAPSLDQLVYPLLARIAGEPADLARAQDIFTGDNGDALYPRATDIDDYVRLATRLIREHGFRAAAGNAAKRFVDEMMSDPRETARDYSAHFMNAIIRKGY